MFSQSVSQSVSKILVALVLTLLSASFLYAGVPPQITYQGMIKEYGQPVTGTRTMDFVIYPQASGGASLWSSNGNSVQVTNGVFTQTLTPNFDLRANQELWIELFVSNKKLAPREKISSQFFALNAANAENLSSTAPVTITVGATPRVVVDATKVQITSGVLMFPDNSTMSTANTGSVAVPRGVISMWSGLNSAIPAGYALCDGKYYDPNDATVGQVGQATGDANHTVLTPDLTDRFIKSIVNYAENPGATGGVASNNISHAHSISADGNHAHTTGDAGGHDHTYSGSVSAAAYIATYEEFSKSGALWNSGHNHSFSGTTSSVGNHNHGGTSTTGSHSHGSSTGSAGSTTLENRPPYYALAFIMKL